MYGGLVMTKSYPVAIYELKAQLLKHLRSVFTVMKGGGAYENYPFCIFHIILHIKQTYQPPPPLRIRQTHTEKRRA